MPMIAPNTGASFDPCPEGKQRLVLVDVSEVVNRETAFGTKPKIDLLFQSERTISAPGEDHDGRPFTVFERLTASLDPRSRLRARLKQMRGRDLNDAEEKQGFDPEDLIGETFYAKITHNDTGEKIFANIEWIESKEEAEVEALDPQDYVRWKDRDDANTNAVFDDDIPF